MTKRFRIPNVDVKLDDDEVAVTQTQAFQHLSDIRQLGLASLIYPAATHTRGAHSIQTLFEARRILSALRENEKNTSEVPITEGEDRDVRMAALLHDISHIPFSHMLEDEMPVLPKHDTKDSYKLALNRLKAEMDDSPAAVARVEACEPILMSLAGDDAGAENWQRDLVGNTVCADLLAYITTDPEWTGIEKRAGSYRIYDYLRRKDNRLCVKLTKGSLRMDVVSCITDLLDMRYALTERVIFHHGKAVASSMLSRAATLARLEDVDRAMLLELGDEGLLVMLRRRLIDLGETDAVQLIDGLRSRRIFKRIFRVSLAARTGRDEGKRDSDRFCSKFRNPSEVDETLSRIEDDHNLPRGSLSLWCPKEESSMKLAETQVIWDAEGQLVGPYALRGQEVEIRFPGVHSRVDAIEKQYFDLWSCWISINRKFVNSSAAVLKDLEAELEVKCDPMFVAEQLRAIPGYLDWERAANEVATEMRPITSMVTESVTAGANRPLTGEAGEGGGKVAILEIAKKTIDSQMKGNASRSRKTRKRRTPSGASQRQLHSDEG